MKLNFAEKIGLDEKLASGKKLKVKLGFDPTSPNLHLGHFVSLSAAAKLQEAGHEIIIIIGDYTAAIGDPTGRSALRPPLSEDEINKNAATYMDQVFLILDKNKTIVKRNSSWLNKINLTQMIKIMASQTLAQILNREDFTNRFNNQTPIFLHELLYPILQGLDSVEIKSDVELGGTDQTFNLMLGRELQKLSNQEPQAIVTFPLLVGLDGTRKMSKSYGNEIALLDSPTDKFGKIMSVSDDTMWNYFEILSNKSSSEINQLKLSCDKKQLNPRDVKLDLAQEIVPIFHGPENALLEKEKFINKFSKKELLVEEEANISSSSPIMLSKLLRQTQMAPSNNEAIRLINQKAVKINGETVAENKLIPPGTEFVLQVGKIKTKKVKLN